MQERWGYVLVSLSPATCAQLDACVAAGVAKDRRQAAEYFLVAGIQARKDIFERIAQTEAQVEQLRQQMRSLKGLECVE